MSKSCITRVITMLGGRIVKIWGLYPYQWEMLTRGVIPNFGHEFNNIIFDSVSEFTMGDLDALLKYAKKDVKLTEVVNEEYVGKEPMPMLYWDEEPIVEDAPIEFSIQKARSGSISNRSMPEQKPWDYG